MLTLILSSLSFAQDAPPPIVGGTTTSDYTPVGSLLAYAEGYGGSGFCSGTLAAEDWVVTAAHCVEAAVEYNNYGYDIYFCTGTSLYSSSGIDECDLAVDLVIHPDYDGRQLQNDIGVVELSVGLRSSGAYALNQDNPSTFPDDMVTYVGWGITDDNRNDSGTKRTVEIPLYDYDSQFIYTYDPTGVANLCSGDSGGAALMWDEGAWELIGVNSFVGSYENGRPCGGENAYAGVARVDAYYDWLVSYVGASGGNNNGNNGGGGGEDTGGGGNNNGGGGEDTGEAPREDTGVGDTAAPDEDIQGDGSDAKGLGCAAVGSRSGGAILLLLSGLLGLRRRR